MRLSLDQVWGVRVLSWRLKFLSGASFNLHVWRKIERTRIDLQVWATEEMMWRLPWGHPRSFCFFGAVFGVWGVNWGPIMMVRASNESWIKEVLHKSKKKFFDTPNFQGPWSSVLGPWGSPGSNGPEMNV